MHRLITIFQKAKKDFLAIDGQIHKIVKSGLNFSFSFCLFSILLLVGYLSSHHPLLFQIGFSFLKSSLFFSFSFIAFGIVFYNLKKQTNS